MLPKTTRGSQKEQAANRGQKWSKKAKIATRCPKWPIVGKRWPKIANTERNSGQKWPKVANSSPPFPEFYYPSRSFLRFFEKFESSRPNLGPQLSRQCSLLNCTLALCCREHPGRAISWTLFFLLHFSCICTQFPPFSPSFPAVPAM